ncbi:DUF3667 domain-containing protein [Croceicoccus sp. F390]|uniref:DUF3667 domain-containing protein n=1 Tax=Croceicoccus esteveae TaxID=3075597 RepID=A0ABU2ZIB7_9SPHN|nr:DUF3667 domain-containing protein [Croceicoccus sp. F390]MDT0576135.1 DUF3667 domain-containing protein [Croceicoccus sp. F390]
MVRNDDGTGDATCRNCGTAIIGPHCWHCGQVTHLHNTFAGVMHDLVHGVLHLDGPVWRTLPLLTWRPGVLTRRYIDGERKKFVSPMGMFLFSIFAMFLVFSILGYSPPADIQIGPENTAAVRTQLATGQRERARLEQQIRTLPQGNRERANLVRRMKEVDREIAVMGELADEPVGDSSALSHMLAKWRKNPSLMLYKLQSSAYKFSWLLVPLSLPLVWLLFFWKRRFGFYDHSVFVTYSISFVSLLFIVLSLAAALGVAGGVILVAAAVIIPWHMFRQIRDGYELGTGSALWRTGAVLVFALFSLCLFLILLVLLGILG